MHLTPSKLSAALNTAHEKPVVEIYDSNGALIVRTTLQELIREAMPAVLATRGPLAIVFGDVLVERVEVRRFPELSPAECAHIEHHLNRDPDTVGEGA